MLAGTVLAACGACPAGNWPQWRGPAATGHTDEKDLPLTWGGKAGANVAWKAPLGDTDDAHSSPVVWGERIFTTTTKGFQHRVVCFARADGRLLWETPIEPGPLQKTDYRLGGVAAPTPATDGRRVYVLFGTAVMAALGCEDGKVAWRRPLAKYAFDVAMGSSPIVYGESVILFSGLTDKTSNLTAFDGATGKANWETVWPEVGFGHSTPAFARVAGRTQLIVTVNHKDGIRGVDGETGKLLWSAPGDGETSSPAVGAATVYCDSGRGGGGFAADIPQSPVAGASAPSKWQLRKVPMELGSPIIVGECVYRLGAGGKCLCLKVADGSEVWEQPLPDASRWASPVATADGRIYYASAGKSYVLRAAPRFDVLAVNDLGDPAHASAAVSDGMIFLKGRKHLYCIAAGAEATANAQAAEAEAPKPAPTAAPKAPSTPTPPGSTSTPPGSTLTPPGPTSTPSGPMPAPPGPTPTPPGPTPTPPGPTPTAPGPTPAIGPWTCISDGVLAEIERLGQKPAWPGKTTGVAVDRTTGDVYLVISGLGVWQSSDKGKTFRRADGGAVGGRCETGYSLQADPGGKRLACFMLDGKSALTTDGGATWTPIKNVARGFDWAAVDWSAKDLRTMFGLVHESGGIGIVSQDGGKTWKEIGKGYHAVGVFGADVLLCGKEKTKGLFRSTDGGQAWQEVADATPIGTMTVFQAACYWLTDQGLLGSADQGKTWKAVGETAAGPAWGPYFGKDAAQFVVVDKSGFRQTADGGNTWKPIAPFPPYPRDYNPRGWFVNCAWDPVGKACYTARMGQPAYKCEP